CQVPSAISPFTTGMCRAVGVSMVLTWPGMSSGPSASCVHPAFSGANLESAVCRSANTDGSAFSWIVSDAEVWRMNSVTAPSFAFVSRTKLSTWEVRSTKPLPDVCTVRSDVARLLAATTEAFPRDIDPDVINTTSNLAVARDVLLHLVRHVDQPLPGALQERHHAIHVLVARQRDFNLALVLGGAGTGVLVVGLPGRGELRLQPFILRLEPADFLIQRLAFVGHRVAGPAGGGIVAVGNRARPGVEADHAVGRRRKRIAAVLAVGRRLRGNGRADPGKTQSGGNDDGNSGSRGRLHGVAPLRNRSSAPVCRRMILSETGSCADFRAIGLAAGFQCVSKQFDPVLAPENLAVEHIDRRAEHVGRDRVLAVLLIGRADLLGAGTLDQPRAGKAGFVGETGDGSGIGQIELLL